MSRRKSKLIRSSFALMGAICGLMSAGARAARQDLPEGKGVEIARDKCVVCHEADVIVAQRLSRQGWTREVEKMIRWGAVVSEAEKEVLLDYLAPRFNPGSGPRSAAGAPGDERGKRIFEEKCLICHEADVAEQQRLSRQGWTREVEKMIRWGAVLSDEEKGALVAYLSGNFGPRPLAPASK
ncbi:MAG: c-type cytochrome [Chloracidobacterium sp.]|nr:c-type cytochrome [Chloracidobacterium sp.]